MGFAVVAVMVMLGGCMRAPVSDFGSSQADDRNVLAATEAIPAQELYARVKRPTTTLAVLKNLKLAFEHDLLLRKDFYTEENLLRFSGGNGIQWREHTEARQWVWAWGFGTMAEPVRTKSFTYEGMTWDAGRTEKADEKIEGGASLYLVMPNSGISFEKVEQLFGKGWEHYDRTVIMPPEGATKSPAPKTHPHGYDRIRYQRGDARVARSVIVEFHGDGTVKTADFHEATR